MSRDSEAYQVVVVSTDKSSRNVANMLLDRYTEVPMAVSHVAEAAFMGEHILTRQRVKPVRR
jgi:hypothetical protein